MPTPDVSQVQGGVAARDPLQMAQGHIGALGLGGLGELLREQLGEDLEVHVPGGDRQFAGDAVGDRDSCDGRRHEQKRLVVVVVGCDKERMNEERSGVKKTFAARWWSGHSVFGGWIKKPSVDCELGRREFLGLITTA